MMEYEILSSPMEILEEIMDDGWGRYEQGRHYDIIEAESAAKAKYIFYKRYLQDDTFVSDMEMIESCRLYKCPLCSGQPLPDDYTLEEYGDEPCQFCKPQKEQEQS